MEDIKFYTSDIKKTYKKKLINASLLTSLFLVSLILLITLSIIFVNRNNKVIVEVVSSILGVILITAFNFTFLAILFPLIKIYKHIVLIGKQTPVLVTNICVTLVGENALTLSTGVKCFEVRTEDDNKTYKVYYLAEFLNKENLPILTKINLEVASSYIVGYQYEK